MVPSRGCETTHLLEEVMLLQVSMAFWHLKTGKRLWWGFPLFYCHWHLLISQQTWMAHSGLSPGIYWPPSSPTDLQMVFTHSTDMDRFTLQSSAVTFGEDGNQHSTALRRKRTAPYKASAVSGAEVWGTTPASGWRSFAGTHRRPVLLPWGKRPTVIVVSQSLGAANGLAPVSVHTDNN